jgi:hypothetical protein
MTPKTPIRQRWTVAVFAVAALFCFILAFFPAQLGLVRDNDYFILNDYGIQRRSLFLIGFVCFIPVILLRWRSVVRLWHNLKLPDAFAYDAQVSLSRDIAREWRWLLLVGAMTLMVHLPLWSAYPLFPGRDSDSWLGGYVDLVERDIPMNFVSTRMPVAPLFYGTLLVTGGIGLTTLGCIFLAISATWMVYLTLRPVGKMSAWGGVFFYLANLPLQVTFHAVGSEALTLWTALLCVFGLRYAVTNRRGTYWFWFGVAVGLACLTRQASLAFAGTGILIWLNFSPWRHKLRNTIALMAGVGCLVLPYMLYRDVHYDSFSLARGNWLLYHHVTRNFNLVQPQHGTASRELADAIEKYILTQPAYTRDGITIENFFNYPEQGAFFTDIIYLSDVILGWDTNYALLNAAAWEAIRAYPELFIRNTLLGIWVTLTDKSEPPPVPHSLPKYIPEEDPEIRRDLAARAAMSLGGAFSTLYARPPDLPPLTQAEIETYLARIKTFLAPLDTQTGQPTAATLHTGIWRFYPPMLFFYAAAAIAILRQGWHAALSHFLLCGAAIAIIAFSTLAGDIWWYRLPYEPIFILAAAPILQCVWQAIRSTAAQKAESV